MQFALLGDDPELVPLAEAIVAQGHKIVWCGDLFDHGQLARYAPEATWAESWETLLSYPRLDGVLVGRAQQNDEQRAEQLRKLVQADVHLLVVHPAVQSMLLYYELDMIHREARGILQQYVPNRRHPLVEKLRELAATGEPGPIGRSEQLICERTLRERTPEIVLGQFARDAELLIAIAGAPDRIGALGTSNEPAVYANLSIQMAVPNGPALRWSVGPVEEEPGARLVLIGTAGRATLHLPASASAAARLEIARGGALLEQHEAAHNAADDALRDFAQRIAQRDYRSDWNTACLTVELADATVRSLEKQRTIPLHSEEYSEAATFKGTMTSVGCALLLGALGVMLVAGLLGDVFGLPPRWARQWPLILVVVLGLFLLLQLLPGLVFAPRAKDERHEP